MNIGPSLPVNSSEIVTDLGGGLCAPLASFRVSVILYIRLTNITGHVYIVLFLYK